MFRRLLGRTGKSAPQNNQIEVVCPLCGAAQREPRLVVTTFCKKCGEHLRIAKDGSVIASVHINPAPSAAYPSVAEANLLGELKEGHAQRERPEGPEAGATPGPPGAGSEWRTLVRKKMLEARRGSPAAGDATSALPAPAPPHPADVRQLQGSGSRNQFHYFKEVECFECRSKFKVGRHARSPNCPACGKPICLEDLDIRVDSTSPVRTGGDVVIRKSASVRASDVRCRNLTVLGRVSANIECTGEFFAGSSGTYTGEVHCHRLVVEEDCEIKLKVPVHACEVEVRGRVSGHILCTGPVKISPTGWIQGDVTARSVSIETGGQLDGAMNIVRLQTASAKLPAPAPAAAPAPVPATTVPAVTPAATVENPPPSRQAKGGSGRGGKGGSRRSK